MIIIRVWGGLGNQLFQYAFGRRLAYEKSQPLILDLTRFQDPGQRSFQLNAFRISAEIASAGEILQLTHRNLGRIIGPLYRAYERSLPYACRSFISESHRSFSPDVIPQLGGNVYLSGYWQSEKYFSSIEPMLRDELKLKSPFSLIAQKWADKLHKQTVTSLHIRRGDYVTGENRNLKPCSPAYFAEAMQYVKTRTPRTTFFVFSDDLDWARQNLNSSSMIEYVETSGPLRDQEELILMSLCDHHIISNSTYGWWGAWLGTAPGKIVVSPREWFSNPESATKDPIPDAWVRL
jgi:hypothetical protein